MTPHAIPDAILDDRLGIIGTSGAGKTFAAKGAVERLLDQAARVCIIDPLSVWHGLRSSADGKHAGYPIVVFGGEHADVPIDEHSAMALAKLIAGTSFACIVDLGDFGTGAARRRFMVSFLEQLYTSNKEPLHLILDEADLWAPQRPMPDQTMLLNRMEEIVRRGRVRGFIPWLITQRPAVLHKDVLSQVDALIALKLTSSQDRDALGSWIEGNADKAEEKRIRAALPGLPRGEGFVWAPAHGILSQVKFPLIKTFDSSRTPKRGERVTGPTASYKVDLSAIKVQLGEVQKKLDEDDPIRLRQMIAELRTQLKENGKAKPAAEGFDAPDLRSEYARGHGDGYDKAKAENVAQFNSYLERAAADEAHRKGVLMNLSNAISSHAGDLSKALADWLTVKPQPPQPPAPRRRSARTEAYIQGGGKRSGPERRLLRVLYERHPKPLGSKVWAVLSRMKHSGGTFGEYVRRLSAAGYITEHDDGFLCTAAGGKVAADVPAQPKGRDLIERWNESLGAERNLWDVILRVYPSKIGRAAIAKEANMTVTGGTFGEYLRRLTAAGLAIEDDSQYRAPDYLYQ